MNQTEKAFLVLAISLWIAGVANALIAAATSPVPLHEKLWIASIIFVITGVVTFVAALIIRDVFRRETK